VHERALAVGPQPSEEPPDVPLAQVQARRGLVRAEPALKHQSERVIPVEIAVTHRNQG